MPTETKHESVDFEQASKTNERKAAAPPRAVAAQRPVSNESPRAASLSQKQRQMIVLAMFLTASAAISSFWIAWKLDRSKTAAPHGTASPAAEGPASQPETSSNGPHAPGVIASQEELARPWSSKRFTYRDPIIGTDVPAMVVHLPDGGYWGFSLVDPIRNCQLEYITDPNRLQSVYHFQADHPMVGDPCNFAVFDLLQYSGPRNAEVRGAPVNGIGVRPPIAIEIEQNGDQILATKIE